MITSDSSLADWGPNLTIGLAMRRQELMVPTHAAPPKNSIAEQNPGASWFSMGNSGLIPRSAIES